MISPEFLHKYQICDHRKCWWCGEPASTKEHKFKRSDLRRMWDPDDLYLVHGDHVRPVSRVRSIAKSPQVRFDTTMCANCNNNRSQPFDRAWEAFSDYVWDNGQRLKWRQYLDAEAIYGTSWPDGLRLISSYVVKHAACRIANWKFEVPSDLIRFLAGDAYSANISMVLFKDRECYGQLREFRKNGVDGRGLYLGAEAVHFSKAEPRITLFGSTISIGCIGVFYRWERSQAKVDLFYRYKRPKLHWHHRLPEY